MTIADKLRKEIAAYQGQTEMAKRKQYTWVQADMILVEFFRENFSEDPAGIGDWFELRGEDIDAFIDKIDEVYPPKTDQ